MKGIEQALRQTTDNYLEFIHRISQGKAFSQMEAAAEILSPNCKKILNGELFTERREDFVSDLLTVHANQGSWEILPADVIISSSSHAAVLRLLIKSTGFGTYTAILILRFDADYLITEINEVLTPVKAGYDF